MVNQPFLGRLGQYLKPLKNMANVVFVKKTGAGKPSSVRIDNYHYESHRHDDLELTLNRDSGPGVRYSYTENSEFARGAEKEQAIGIDSFGEEDTFDPKEADEHQDYRNRKQNSDLSRRFFTGGMDLNKLNFDK